MTDIPAAARRLLDPLSRKAAELGLPVYLVGGCVRDWPIGARTRDLDVVAEGDPAPLAELCGKLLRAKPVSFGRFGTLRVVGNIWRVDLAAARREEYPEPACLPRVRPAALEDDLSRRDFTVNAMALRLHPGREGRLIDPFGGMKDLRARVLRVLHPLSFRDDPTRVFRAARYMCRLSLKPAPGLLAMARAALKAGYPRLLSRHRLAQELLRILTERDPARALSRLREWGYLQLLHSSLRAPPEGFKAPSERLGAMALALGPKEGERFLSSLPLERPLAHDLQETLRLAAARRSPRGEPPEAALAVIPAFFKKLSRNALRPLFVDGKDLKALGVPEGKRYREILDAAAEAQWAGDVASRAEALAWLRRYLA